MKSQLVTSFPLCRDLVHTIFCDFTP